MTTKEYFVQLMAGEIEIFERVFKALPTDKLDWRPHERSKSAMELIQSMAVEGKTFVEPLETGVLDYTNFEGMQPKSLDEAITMFREGMTKAKDLAAKMSDEDWAKPASMMMGGKSVWDAPRGEMALSLLLDLVHHRGQLSTYIRPMGGKVPSIYGPSADSGNGV